MAPVSGADLPYRERLAGICLGLPVAAREDHGRHTRFLVRARAFAYFLEDHHGDGRVAATVKALPDRRDMLLNAAPDRFFLPPYLGPRGWLGIHLDAPATDWAEVAALVADSYRLVALKWLAARV